jgi:predicted GIY-YIG superfamily endonuclease
MALSQWWSFTDTLVDMDREDPGVYQFGDDNEKVVYVGSAIQLKRRLKEHLGESTTSCIKRNAKKYRIEYTTAADRVRRERELYDEHVRIHSKPPICNSVRP